MSATGGVAALGSAEVRLRVAAAHIEEAARFIASAASEAVDLHGQSIHTEGPALAGLTGRCDGAKKLVTLAAQVRGWQHAVKQESVRGVEQELKRDLTW